jgi:uncharacterized membrane protein (DUF106 family)
MAAKDENPCGGPMGFITLISVMFVMLILFDPNLGEAVGEGMGAVMGPLTFDDKYPIWTIFMAGMILVILTSFVRHKFTDWYQMAKTQKIQAEFNKELREATMSGDTIKAKKLREMQPEMLKLTNQLMFSNMKTMVFTMLFAILIWRWLFTYLGDAPINTVSMPWSPSWEITKEITGCFLPLPYWVAIYFVVSVPLGQVLISMFKVVEFSKESRDVEKSQADKLQGRLDELSAEIETAQSEGISTARLDDYKLKIRSALEEKEYYRAENQLNEAEGALEQNRGTLKRTREMIANTKVMIDSARARGVEVHTVEAIMANAEAALARHDYTKAIYYAKQCQNKLKTSKERHSEAEDALREVRELYGTSNESIKSLMAGRLQNTETAMSGQHYSEVLENVKAFKGELDTKKKTFGRANDELEKARKLRAELMKLSINLSSVEDKFRHAEDKYNLADYDAALDAASDVREELERLKKLYEDASESVSFAKLVVANALNFGAEVSKAEVLVTEAEMALSSHDYRTALSKATTAKNLAEDAKRQRQREQKRTGR